MPLPAVEVESRPALQASIAAHAAFAKLFEDIVTTDERMLVFDGVSVGKADPAT